MKNKIKIAAIAIIVLLCFGIFLSRHILLSHLFMLFEGERTPSLSVQQIQALAQESGGNEVLQQEATKAMLNYNNGNATPDINITNCPAIIKMASLMTGEVIDVEPAGASGIGIPAHILIRRGSHFDYQFIYIFGVGMTPSSGSSQLKFIGDGIYLRNTAP
jgi:hypothetical protein